MDRSNSILDIAEENISELEDTETETETERKDLKMKSRSVTFRTILACLTYM